jgi:glycosyltransferase involved in cell wall biosynthesis
MKRVLILAYDFPPDGSAGAQRPLKFVKYLGEYGWQADVITHTPDDACARCRPNDPTLAHQIHPEVEIIRVGIPPPGGARTNGSALDPFERWCIAAGRAGCRRLDLIAYDAVLLTMPPFSLVRAAQEIRRQHRSVPIVLDFRDPWVLDGWLPQRTYWHWQRQFRVMAQAIHAADAVIANTPEAARVFLNTFAHLDPARLTVIENGFDSEDFAGIRRDRNRQRDAPFTLVFAGTLSTNFIEWYSGLKGWAKSALRYSPERPDFSGRTLIHVLAAIRMLREHGMPFAHDMQIRCLGADSEADRRSAQASGIGDAVDFVGYVPHAESIREICEADALLLPLHGLPPGERSRIVPAKTYEYVAAGRPILGCLPDGDARDLVNATGIGAVARPTSVREIASALQRLNGICAELPRDHQPPPWMHRYARHELARRLARFLDGVEVQRRSVPVPFVASD